MSGFAPSEEWIEAFEAQATDDLYEKATRYAWSRALGVARAGGVADDLYVLSLVQDAFTDTLCGMLAWNPAAASLEQQIICAIRSRTRHDREHARRFRRVRLDTGAAEVEAALAVADERDAACDADARIAELRALAAHDADVLLVLDGIGRGAATRSTIIAETGLSAKRYRNARWRLAALVKRSNPPIQRSPGRA